VTLTLTASVTGGTCPPASDQARIAFEKAATANAGADLVVCTASPRAQLAWSAAARSRARGAAARARSAPAPRR
jgi:hypothetical protein